MNHRLALTITSLLSIVLFSFHWWTRSPAEWTAGLAGSVAWASWCLAVRNADPGQRRSAARHSCSSGHPWGWASLCST